MFSDTYRNLRFLCTDMMTSALPRTAARMIDEKMNPLSTSRDTSTQLSSPRSGRSSRMWLVLALAMACAVEFAARKSNGLSEDAKDVDDADDVAVNDSEVNEASKNCSVVGKLVVATAGGRVVANVADVAVASSGLPLVVVALVVAAVAATVAFRTEALPVTSVAIDWPSLLLVDADVAGVLARARGNVIVVPRSSETVAPDMSFNFMVTSHDASLLRGSSLKSAP